MPRHQIRQQIILQYINKSKNQKSGKTFNKGFLPSSWSNKKRIPPKSADSFGPENMVWCHRGFFTCRFEPGQGVVTSILTSPFCLEDRLKLFAMEKLGHLEGRGYSITYNAIFSGTKTITMVMKAILRFVMGSRSSKWSEPKGVCLIIISRSAALVKTAAPSLASLSYST